jgi:hypothetical protein
MTKRTAEAPRTQAENGARPALAHLVEPMLAGMMITRQHLLAWVHAQGPAALDELFREEAVAWAGPKGCGIGSWSGSCLSMADYVTVMGPARA